jgi:hypothetical protein
VTATEAIESEAKARVRLMLKHSPSFRELLGLGPAASNTLVGNEAFIDARIHDDEIIENQDPANSGPAFSAPAPSGPAPRPLALIHNAKFDYAATSQGEFNEWEAGGDVRLLIESQYLGDQIVDGQSQRKAFEQLTGRIRTELVGLIQNPLGTEYYTAFHAIRATIPVSRTPKKQRTATSDFFAAGWLFVCGNEGGE